MVQLKSAYAWFLDLLLRGMENRPSHHSRAVATYGLIALILFTAGLIFRVTYYFSTEDRYHTESVFFLVLTSVLSLLVFVIPILARRSLVAAEIFFIVFGTAQLLPITYAIGKVAGFQYFMVFFGYIVFLSNGTRYPIRLTAYVIYIVGFLVFCSSAFPEPAIFVDLPAERLEYFRQFNITFGLVIITILILVFQRRIEFAEEKLASEYVRSEGLLRNLLPDTIATRLKAQPDVVIVDDAAETSILFADIVGFTSWSNRIAARELVETLNNIFQTFDVLTSNYGLEKIKTIGDAYMVVGGLPTPKENHAESIADLALKMQEAVSVFVDDTGAPVQLRIGIQTGPAVAGVIGKNKVFYDVWGDTVNTASRLEGTGQSGKIQITAQMKERLGPEYKTKRRGIVDIKGLGKTETYWLLSGPRLEIQS